MKHPHTKSRLVCDSGQDTVLVTTIGTSPSVLTSTVWALAQQEGLLPHRIVVLTTRLGRERLLKQVFTRVPEFGGNTVWESLCQTLEADGFDLAGRLEFAPEPAYLRVFTATPPGKRTPEELDDITSQLENERVADAMLEALRGVMADGTRIVASIAGGRKTVSALFYACVSLVGRDDDRVIHVVVNEPFDRTGLQPPFFFPGQQCSPLLTADGRIVAAQSAKLSIINVPFVPLAKLFLREFRRTPARFSTLVADYREAGQHQSLTALQLTVHRRRAEIEVDGVPVALGPREHLLVLLLAERLLAGRAAFPSIKDLAVAVEERRKQFVSSRAGTDLGDWSVKLGCTCLDEQDVRRALSNFGIKLRKLGLPVARLAGALPQRGGFSLALQKKQVRLVD